jgi:hypothetical protein
MTFPNFIIAGPPKTGTTSLYSWLSEHPDVCSSSVKETYFLYLADEEVFGVHQFTEEELVNYSSFFDDCNGTKIIFEATPSYIYSESARQALYQINPEIKILFVLREPSDRLYSEYTFHRYKTGKFNGEFSSYAIEDRIQECRYGSFIAKWVELFGKKNIAVVNFKDLKDRPEKLMKRLSSFLKIDPNHYENFNFDQKNKTVIVRNKSLHKLLLKLINIIPLAFIKRVSPIYYGLNSKTVPSISPKDQQEKDRLKLLLREDWQNVLKTHSDMFIL